MDVDNDEEEEEEEDDYSNPNDTTVMEYNEDEEEEEAPEWYNIFCTTIDILHVLKYYFILNCFDRIFFRDGII